MVSKQKTAFRPLKVSGLQPETGFQHPYYYHINPAKVSSPALEVMTDLKFLPAATCTAQIDIALARQTMISRGVRLLLVIDATERVVGLITARDLDGAKADYIKRVNGRSPELIHVAEVMTPAAQIEVLQLADVVAAHVGDVIETLKGSGRQHALVVDRRPTGDQFVLRGIFSASQIARQLGLTISGFDLAGTFAELDTELKKAAG